MKKIIAIGFVILLFCASLAWAIDVHFHWGASTGQVDGYKIYWGDTQGGPYPSLLCEVNGTTLDHVASLDEAREYFLICRAFNSYGESGDSNEVRWYYAIPGIPGSLQWSVDLAEIIKNLGADQIKFVSKE